MFFLDMRWTLEHVEGTQILPSSSAWIQWTFSGWRATQVEDKFLFTKLLLTSPTLNLPNYKLKIIYFIVVL